MRLRHTSRRADNDSLHRPEQTCPRVRRVRSFGLLLTALLLTGCGGAGVELIDVAGVVTLDDKPLPKALIIFTPVASDSGSGRPSIAETDANGAYKLEYSTEHSGVRPGQYRVTISTYREQTMDNLERVTPRAPELVPEVYNTKSTLTADVKAGASFDFALKSSEGPVVQPDAPRKTGSVTPSRSGQSPAAARS